MSLEEYNSLIRSLSLSNDDSGSMKKNGPWRSKKNGFRSRSMPPGAKRSSFKREPTFKSTRYISLSFQQVRGRTRASEKDSKSSAYHEATMSTREVLSAIERMLRYFRALPFFGREKKAEVIKALQELKQRFTSSNRRVKQHEAKLRRILYKLGQLDSDVYDLQDPDDVHLLHQNWKDLYDEIEGWLGGPEAAMTSGTSTSDTDDDQDQKSLATAKEEDSPYFTTV